ncbi:MAG TPA: hypothetical protein VLG16_06040 [Candidatus Saccharimonadales bacterium]|nr:hypothetical protein [Candidatus Saccharimonadales bacterium]
MKFSEIVLESNEAVLEAVQGQVSTYGEDASGEAAEKSAATTHKEATEQGKQKAQQLADQFKSDAESVISNAPRRMRYKDAEGATGLSTLFEGRTLLFSLFKLAPNSNELPRITFIATVQQHGVVYYDLCIALIDDGSNVFCRYSSPADQQDIETALTLMQGLKEQFETKKRGGFLTRLIRRG